MKNKLFLKGAIVLIVCNLIGKILGAIYRIPLSRLLGPVGMGMYQLIFPLYTMLLTISTAGIPVSISKLVAEYNAKNEFFNSKKIFKIAVILLTVLSFLAATFVAIAAKFVATMQGNSSVYVCYYAIAPAILFVGILSAFRGYFQGNILMFPTAISSLVEQVVKMAFGLFLAGKWLQYGVEYAVLGAIVAISISELVAVVFLFVNYLIYNHRHKVLKGKTSQSFKFLSKSIIGLSLPVTASSIIAPITNMIDSFLVVNLLMMTGYSSAEATSFLGLQSGVVESLVNVPVIIAVSISTVLLPNISAAQVSGSKEKVKELAEKSFQIALCISICCSICFFIFGKQILTFLYGKSFSEDNILTATELLFAGSFNIVILSLVQVTTAILQGVNKTKIPVKSLFIGCGLKIAADCILIPIKKINIFGVVISAAICYLFVFFRNYKFVKEYTTATIKKPVFYISIQAVSVAVFAFVSNVLCKIVLGDILSLFVSGLVAVLVFFVVYYVFYLYENEGGLFYRLKIK